MLGLNHNFALHKFRKLQNHIWIFHLEEGFRCEHRPNNGSNAGEIEEKLIDLLSNFEESYHNYKLTHPSIAPTQTRKEFYEALKSHISSIRILGRYQIEIIILDNIWAVCKLSRVGVVQSAPSRENKTTFEQEGISFENISTELLIDYFNINVLDSISEGILLVDNEEQILYANRGFSVITGFEQEELLGKRASDIFLDFSDDVQKIQEVNQDRRHNKSSSYEVRIKTKNGSHVWLSIYGVPLKNKSGQVVGSIGVHTNISALKKNIQDLEEILFSLSHKMRQPINRLSGLTEILLQTEPNNAKSKEIYQFIHESTQNLDLFSYELNELLVKVRNRNRQN